MPPIYPLLLLSSWLVLQGLHYIALTIFKLLSSFQPLPVLSFISLALPTAPTTPLLTGVLISTPLFTWDHSLNLAGSLSHDAHARDASLGPPSTQEMLPAFFPPQCSAVESWALQLNPVTIPKHSWLIPTTAWQWVPTDDKDMPSFQEHWVSSCELPKAVYGRTEEFELHNRQLQCPLIPLPFIQFVVCL